MSDKNADLMAYSRMRYEQLEAGVESAACAILEARFDRLDESRRLAFVEQLKIIVSDLKYRFDLFDGTVKDYPLPAKLYFFFVKYPFVVRPLMKKLHETLCCIEEFVTIYHRHDYLKTKPGVKNADTPRCF